MGKGLGLGSRVTALRPLSPHRFLRNSLLYTFFFLRPIFRLLIAYLYINILYFFFGYWPSTDISVWNYVSDISVYTESSGDTESSWHSNSINPAENFHDEHPLLPNENNAPNHNGIPVDVVDQFRILNFEMELELFARIRILENRMIEGLPPQLNLGEYETLVRGFLNQTLTIEHYCNTMSNELFEIAVMELKANLVDQLSNLLVSEPTARLTQILSDSPFPEGSIRPEALEFLNDFMDRLNLHEPRSTFEKGLVEAMLRYWIQDVQQNAHRSSFYLEFVKHFRGDL